MIQKLRYWVFMFLESDDESRVGVFGAYALSGLIVLNIASMVLETVPELAGFRPALLWFETLSLAVFTVEYFLRIWVAPLASSFISRISTIFGSFLFFDLLVLLPFWYSFVFPGEVPLEMLMIFRVFRLLRLRRYFDSLYHLLVIIYRHKSYLLSAFLLIFFTILLASTAMYYAEHTVQPEKFTSIVHSFYWAIVTFATIGYGDIVPITPIGKIITVLVAMMGVLLYALPTYIIGSAFYEEIRSAQAKELDMLREKVKLLEAEKKHRDTLLPEIHSEQGNYLFLAPKQKDIRQNPYSL